MSAHASISFAHTWYPCQAHSYITELHEHLILLSKLDCFEETYFRAGAPSHAPALPRNTDSSAQNVRVNLCCKPIKFSLQGRVILSSCTATPEAVTDGSVHAASLMHQTKKANARLHKHLYWSAT